jgi:hypothetical protein
MWYGRCQIVSQMDPEVSFWRSVFRRLWYRNLKNHTFSRIKWFPGLATFGGKARKPFSVQRMCGLMASVPQVSKKQLGQKPSSGSQILLRARTNLLRNAPRTAPIGRPNNKRIPTSPSTSGRHMRTVGRLLSTATPAGLCPA